MPMTTLVVIPAYNEGWQLHSVVESVTRFADHVLVVDDGSCPAVSLSSGEVTVLRHGRNQGKGAALRTGLEYALAHGYTKIAFMDGDGQHDPSCLPAFFAALDHYPVAVGTRRRDWTVAMPRLRRWTSMRTDVLNNFLSPFRME